MAKSKGSIPPAVARQIRQQSGLPEGFRHEMLSAQLLEHRAPDLLADLPDPDLVLHLIATHHGHARPWAPVVKDEELPPVEQALLDRMITATHTDRHDWPPAHRLDSGLLDRFWHLTRRYGWWGLAYLEALLRLSDWHASANPSTRTGQSPRQEVSR